MTTAVLSQSEDLHWLALRMLPGLGTRGAVQLVQKMRSPMAVFRASLSELEAVGLSKALARSIHSGCTFEDAADQQQKILACGARVITFQDPAYPERLRQIYDPPLVLFVRGKLELLDSLAIAVVGTRRPSPYGIAAAERLSADLALAGLTIISGMARGIDTAAHRGALSVGGNTLAVFGCGIDIIYPSDNRKLYEEILNKGLVLSEFPMGAPAFPQNFPIRNRIVSGLSLGVLVVEGAQYSGSGITARLAVDQGREVFAVPGNITSKMSWGPNLLIRQGATLVQDWSDIVSELPDDARRELIKKGQQKILFEGEGSEDGVDNKPEEALPALARKVLRNLQIDVPQQLEGLLASFDGVSSSELIAALFELEMTGLVRQLPGKNFVKVW